MITANTLVNKTAVVAMLPALAMGLFATPAMAMQDGPIIMPPFYEDEGVTTIVNVTNVNSAAVVNAFDVSANTGDNVANGGDGDDGGNSGDSGEFAGNGGDAGDGGDGGDATSRRGGNYSEGGAGAEGGNGGVGGNTGATGDAGDGGNGGNGGQIVTGDATASVAISNDVNTNDTDISVEYDCAECAAYDEYYAEADTYYETHHDSQNDVYDEECCGVHEDNSSESDSTEGGSHWEVYTKSFVPVTTVLNVTNLNDATVMNAGSIEAETGDNIANGGDGEDGGNSGDSGDEAGNGGDGADGGNGGDANAAGCSGTAVAGDGETGGNGARGGNTGATGDAGNGGNGGNGGVIVTGKADVLAAVVNVVNRSVTRIVR